MAVTCVRLRTRRHYLVPRFTTDTYVYYAQRRSARFFISLRRITKRSISIFPVATGRKVRSEENRLGPYSRLDGRLRADKFLCEL